MGRFLQNGLQVQKLFPFIQSGDDRLSVSFDE
jgi:hypothetical protein